MSETQHQRLLWYFSCPSNCSNACCNASPKTSSKHIGAAFAVRGREDGWRSARYRFMFLLMGLSNIGLNPLPLVYHGSQDKSVTRQVKTLHVIVGQPRGVCCLLLSGQGGLTRTWAETSPQPECDPFYSSHHAATPHRAARHTCRPGLTMSNNTQRSYLSAQILAL